MNRRQKRLKVDAIELAYAMIRAGHPVQTLSSRLDLVDAAVDIAQRVEREVLLKEKQ
jgi:hypothetical protein